MRKFVLLVDYGTGRMGMLTDTPDISAAIAEFQEKKSAGMPDSKCYGLPPIKSAELVSLMYESIYEGKGEE